MQLYSSLIARLQTQHKALPIIISKIPGNRLLLKPNTGKWSIKDNIAHLTRYQLVFIGRLHQIVQSNTPIFEAYKAETDAWFTEWQLKDIGSLLEQINADRKMIVEMLMGLSAENLDKIGVHTNYGRLNIVDWTEFFLLHEAHHLFTIFKLAHDRTF